jgi:uncharacterized protein YdhG (YjbR/CyaY superfamily)
MQFEHVMKERTGMRIAAVSVEDYLAGLPEDARNALEHLRKMIKKVVPDAIEVISYQIPTFRSNERMLVAYSASKKHCSLHLMSPSVMSAHKTDLQSYETTKATVHFTTDKPLPFTLVSKLVKARVDENEARKKHKRQ